VLPGTTQAPTAAADVYPVMSMSAWRPSHRQPTARDPRRTCFTGCDRRQAVPPMRAAFVGNSCRLGTRPVPQLLVHWALGLLPPTCRTHPSGCLRSESPPPGFDLWLIGRLACSPKSFLKGPLRFWCSPSASKTGGRTKQSHGRLGRRWGWRFSLALACVRAPR
jgi:hypothetical protein